MTALAPVQLSKIHDCISILDYFQVVDIAMWKKGTFPRLIGHFCHDL